MDSILGKSREELKKLNSLIEVLAATGVRLRRDIEGVAAANCPFPTHLFRSPSFRIKLSEPEHFWCEDCGARGNKEDYITALYAPPLTAEQSGIYLGPNLESEILIEKIADNDPVSIELERKKANEQWLTATYSLHDVYQGLLNELELLDSHRDYLVGRELSASICNLNDYRSLPVSRERRIAICEKLSASGHCLDKVSGFFRIPSEAPDSNVRGRWCIGGDTYGRRTFRGNIEGKEVRYEIGGMLVPVRDLNWNIVGLEILNDSFPLDAPQRLKHLWPPRFCLLTSNMQLDGSDYSSLYITPLHYAGYECPENIWVTDGALRADLLSNIYNARVLGMLRLGEAWEEVLTTISSYSELIVAFDSNELLWAARLCREAERIGIKAFVASWDHAESIIGDEFWSPIDDFGWGISSYDEWWSNRSAEQQKEVESRLLLLK